MNCGVYLIRCVSSGRGYVGSSRIIKRRWKAHLTQLRSNRHPNFKLQCAWNKHGEGAFSFEVLELCSEDQLREREVHWIASLNSFKQGYNCSELGAGPDEKTRKLIAEANRRRKDAGSNLRVEARSPEGRSRRSEMMRRLNLEGRCGMRNPLAKQRALEARAKKGSD